MTSTHQRRLMPSPEMDPTLRAAVAAALSVAEANSPSVLHFSHRRADGYRLLPALEGYPQPGDDLFADGDAVGTVAGVCQWWVHAAGGRVKVVVVEVG